VAENTCSLTDLACQWTWIVDEVKALFVWFSEQIFNALLAVIDAIPMPAWTQNAGGLSLPPEVVWFASAFELHYGAVVVASAYGIRFLIRRMPIIG
jgi:hypothetical protein